MLEMLYKELLYAAARSKLLVVIVLTASITCGWGKIKPFSDSSKTVATPLAAKVAQSEFPGAYGLLKDPVPVFTNFSETQKVPEERPSKGQWKVVRMRVTAYEPSWKSCGKFADGYTANMHKIRYGDVFVAADKKYSFGTEMIIPGYNNGKPVKVMDRGGKIKGNRLDVFYPSIKQARKWGVQYLDVLVKVN